MGNTMQLINRLFLVFLLMPMFAFAEDDLSIELNHFNSDLVQLLILNKGFEDRKFETNFCLSSHGKLSFQIIGKGNDVYKLSSFLNEKCDSHKELLLEPYRFVGRIFHIDEFESYYDLKKGMYKIEANVCFSSEECLHSNELTITVD